MNTGHRRTLATIYARSAEEALRCFANLTMRNSPGLTLPIIEEEITPYLGTVVFVRRLNGNRAVQEIRYLQEALEPDVRQTE